MQTFKEEQKMTQWWLWLLLLGITAIPFWGLYKQLFMGETFGTNPMPNWGLILFALFQIAFLAFFFILQLKTEINQEGININYVPFLKKRIHWNEVQSAQVIEYGFVGGWGVRLGTRYGTVYNTKGKIGLYLKLKNGKKLVIGTQKESEMKDLIQNIPIDS